MFVSIIVGSFSLARSVISFLISVGYFGPSYPSEIDPNMYDFLSFFFFELILSLIIGYTRQRDDKNRFNEKFDLDSFDFNKNYENLAINPEKNPVLSNDLKDPLLDKYEKF
jgi:hypothetical protein